MAISLGSSCGDRSANVAAAIEWLRATFAHLKSSSIYRTPPISGIGEDYYNAVAVCDTDADLVEVNSLMKAYEQAHGRTSEAVTIDLDIVIYDGNIVRPKDFQREYFRRGYMELSASSESVS